MSGSAGGINVNIVKKITIELTPDDLREIVADYLKKDGYEVSKEDVKFDVRRRLEGYGPGEHEVTELTGCKVVANLNGGQK